MEQLGAYFYFFIIGAALLLTIMGLWFATIMPVIDRWSKHLFITYFASLLLCSVVSLVDIILFPYHKSETAQKLLSFFETFFLSLPLPMLTAYLLHCRGKKLYKNKLLRTVILLWSAFFVLLVSTFFTHNIYYITADNIFHRGFLFPLLILPLLMIMVINLIATLCSRKFLSRMTFNSFLVFSVPITTALLLHIFIDVTPLLDISIVISAVFMFGLILSEQIKENTRQQQEITRQRASVMMLQMRPHFVYNTLMTIYSLCNQDPQKARQVTLDFTNYLRKNFNAVANDSTIPFTAELEHTKAYLGVEQAQFEDMLFVKYDTPFTQFRLPPLTLQPIVENAVKHGMNPYLGPLHNYVRTRHTDAGTEIIVEDDGNGYDPTDTTKPHTALENIENRLQQQCAGTFSIKPRPNGGTVVNIFIPTTNK